MNAVQIGCGEHDIVVDRRVIGGGQGAGMVPDSMTIAPIRRLEAGHRKMAH